ncbi:MAG: hypothetical protein COV60_02185 [Candidatus Magasanikbacteria bacterium CG11_big_fil_rev_8_21_14_0_20_43_7]|uniref:Uncharacterized protein n=1 Tax=Candidatus Magasanikbacteria bacterium CG11_big_fil_rev_8_21_14_0_20_43_7 TaxID=1974654 RepID=A0A2H0N4Q1_9BACT|nr:MAG: hypothetical protein COV60_02185 [Candidatus Magasanikbacteria bacterium CG11_big_fil_rev_8_21_14_0_20_43_7]
MATLLSLAYGSFIGTLLLRSERSDEFLPAGRQGGTKFVCTIGGRQISLTQSITPFIVKKQ